ncbi:MAG: APC family permease [Lagierella massiliensis]|nr:APC family permease [Lagierella massiliensis]
MKDNKLNKNLSIINMIALSSGAVIGGWLAEAPYWFQTTGAGAAFIFPILAILLIPVGMAFGELTAMLPFASGVDIWTTNAFNHKMGFGVQWMMFLVQVVEPPLMAFIFGTVINYFIPLTQLQILLIGLVVVTIWYIASNFDVKLAGTLSTVFFVIMICSSLVVSFSFIFSSAWSMENITTQGGFFPKGGMGIFIAMAVFSLKYIGFEMAPTLIEETNFPAKDIWKVILSALLIPAALYFVVVLAMGGMAPWEEIGKMTMPEPEIVNMHSLPKVLGIVAIASGLLHAFTTLMGFWTSSTRVLYGAAELNQLPKSFSKVNKHGQPYISNLVVYVFTILFCLFSGSNWVQYIYAISSIAAGVVYFVSCINVIVLRKKHPEWERPFKAPGGTAMMVLGMIISVWIIVGASLELDLGGYISLIGFIVVGFIVYLLSKSHRGDDPERQPITLTPKDIDRY